MGKFKNRIKMVQNGIQKIISKITLAFLPDIAKIIDGVTFLNSKLDEQNKLRDLLANNVGKLIHQHNIDNTKEILKNLQLAEFQVYSQWGDDGIIQFLVSYLNIKNKKFIEFGVECYSEANTRYLLINNNWEGLIIDGSQQNIDHVKQSELNWKYNLTSICAFITKENINKLIKESRFDGEIGLLHIDIDGNDYWIWKEITVCNPIIVIVEYNSVFGDNNDWTIPYQEDFIRANVHKSCLYFGASLGALCSLANEKGYSFVGCNSAGNNAYFVRNDQVGALKLLTANEGYVLSQFREARDENGKLTYITGKDRLHAIEGMPIYNLKSNRVVQITC